MTEIKIEKRKVVWPWLIFTFVIIAIAIYFLGFTGKSDNEKEVTNTTDHLKVNENNSAIIAFVSFVRDDSNSMSMDHAYTNEALYKLAAATHAIASEIDYEVQGDLDKVKEYADKITNNQFETTHADNIRKATDILTGVLENIQRAKYPRLTDDVAGLRMASTAINPDLLTLDQREAVKGYFNKAADVLQKMIVNAS